MRKGISIILAGLLLILPVEQVLAQAVQQQAVSVQQTRPPNPAAALLRVPPLSENSVRLLRASSDPALLDAPFANPSSSNADAVVGWSDWSTKKRTWVVIGIVASVLLVVAILVFGEDSLAPDVLLSPL